MNDANSIRVEPFQKSDLRSGLLTNQEEVKGEGEIMFFAAISNGNERRVGNCESTSGFVLPNLVLSSGFLSC
jgi:hypothetical protein